MTDLAHTYTTDIQFQETQVDAADTQFDIQRMGQNCNYEIDAIAPVVSALTLLEATVCRFTYFEASGFYGATSTIIFTTGLGGPVVSMAIVFVAPGVTVPAATFTPSGFFGTYTQLPAAPVAGLIRNPGTEVNKAYFQQNGQQWKTYVEFPAHTDLYFATSQAGNFTIRGIAFHA